ncbi:hypothetical protein AEQ67_24120 [Pseudomonas sp. RIT-PI-q]|uniref:hypothetical protein n=1 Tax=Pseudomonas sp. RIT-PI-q TaxID=1690247 RepID=UPI0006CD81C6|nr:hypothetical protein [Pseudomonas sp. RIT-PI-q]KPG94368.1 hypothetical protein AEQ67_24120 [Pseudomonas sp. RIT-PI-q]
MTKLKKRITNPMTLIAIFATLSETSAAVSLPFLDNKEREVYIWFLISFPFYLLFLFFITLNFNYRSLYAPSDFEKGKHFIKVMDSAERSESTAPAQSVQRPRTTQDPPTEADSQRPFSVQHHVRLAERLKDLYIIDARRMHKETQFSDVLDKIQKDQGRLAHAIVFITCNESELLLKKSAFKHSRHPKKRSSMTFCMAYNLCSQGVTLIDQHVLTDTQPSAAL